jgi:hypothetical protein
LLTYNLDGSSSCKTTNCATWPRYVHCFAVTVSYRVAAVVVLPESILLGKSHDNSSEAFLAGLEKYAEHANVAKAVDEALCVEKDGFDRARLGNALLQIAVNNSFSVHS